MNILQQLIGTTRKLINLAKITFASFFLIWASSAAAQNTPETGWWSVPAEGGSGYGIEYSAKTDRIAFSMYTYDTSGNPIWYTAFLDRKSGNVFEGDLVYTTKGQYLFESTPQIGGPASDVHAEITLDVRSNRTANLDIKGFKVPSVFKRIERFEFIPGSGGLDKQPSANQPQNGWWTDPQQDGKGYFIETQGEYTFIAGYTYNTMAGAAAADTIPFWYTVITRFSPVRRDFEVVNIIINTDGQAIGQPHKDPTERVTTIPFQLQLIPSSSDMYLTILDGQQFNATLKRFDF